MSKCALARRRYGSLCRGRCGAPFCVGHGPGGYEGVDVAPRPRPSASKPVAKRQPRHPAEWTQPRNTQSKQRLTSCRSALARDSSPAPSFNSRSRSALCRLAGVCTLSTCHAMLHARWSPTRANTCHRSSAKWRSSLAPRLRRVVWQLMERGGRLSLPRASPASCAIGALAQLERAAMSGVYTAHEYVSPDKWTAVSRQYSRLLTAGDALTSNCVIERAQRPLRGQIQRLSFCHHGVPQARCNLPCQPVRRERALSPFDWARTARECTDVALQCAVSARDAVAAAAMRMSKCICMPSRWLQALAVLACPSGVQSAPHSRLGAQAMSPPCIHAALRVTASRSTRARCFRRSRRTATRPSVRRRVRAALTSPTQSRRAQQRACSVSRTQTPARSARAVRSSRPWMPTAKLCFVSPASTAPRRATVRSRRLLVARHASGSALRFRGTGRYPTGRTLCVCRGKPARQCGKCSIERHRCAPAALGGPGLTR